MIVFSFAACLPSGLAKAAGKADAPTVPSSSVSADAYLPPSLLDEVGKLAHPISAQQVATWKQEVNTPGVTASRAARLHLWLGDYELAANEQPQLARWHFALTEKLVPRGDFQYAQAEYDTGVALNYQGAYAESAAVFRSLLMQKDKAPNFDCRECALWLRHVEISTGYHEDHARLGIPEPPRLDPRCGAAALAACLQSLSLPYDAKTVLANCRVTGEGSNLQDLMTAASRLGANARAVTADDATMAALPKPLIAHVEHDHFIAVTDADAQGVAYLCSDCGAWPGGKVRLSWTQWDALNPDAYATVSKPGSDWDRTLVSVLNEAHPHLNGVNFQIASTGGLTGLVTSRYERVSANAPKQKHFGIVNPHIIITFSCGGGSRFNSIHPPAFTSSPSDGDPVNLATFEEELRPSPDLVAYNPHGPSVVWQRVYDSLRSNNSTGTYDNSDFGDGWSHAYNVGVNDPSAMLQQIAQGGSATLSATTDNTVGTTVFWKVVSSGDSTVFASDSTSDGPGPQGWSVSSSDGINVAVSAPANALTTTGHGFGIAGSQYWVQISDGSTYNVSVYFNVAGAGSPSGTVCTAGTKYLILDNGARVGFNAPSVPTTASPNVSCPALTGGTPYLLEWDFDSNNAAGHYTITFPDRTRWITTRVNEINGGSTFAFVSSLAQIIDRNGNGLSFHYGTLDYGDPLLQTISDTGTGTVLLTISRTLPSFPYAISSVTDAYGRSVYYQDLSYIYNRTGYVGLMQVDQIVPTNTTNPPSRASYTYLFPGLNTITVPSPAGGTGTSVTTITYTGNYVSAVADSNGVTRNYSVIDANRTQVAVADNSGHTAYSYSVLFDNNLNELSRTDGRGHVVSQSVYADPNDAYRPSSILDGNNALQNSYQCTPGGSTNFAPTGTDRALAGGVNYWQIYLGGISGPLMDGAQSATGPNGWSVLYDYGANAFMVTAPASAQLTNPAGSTHYEVVFTLTSGYGTSAYFDVVAQHNASLFTWDQFGNLLTSTTPRGTTTTYTYDYSQFALGEQTQVQQGTNLAHPKSPTTFTYYEPSGLVDTINTPAPGSVGSTSVATTTFTYDSLGNVLTVAAPAAASKAGATITTTYNYTSDPTYSYTQSDAIGQPVTVTDAVGKITHLRYDARGELITTIDALGNETDQTYTIAGQPWVTTLPATNQTGTGRSTHTNTYLYTGGPLTSSADTDESAKVVRQVNSTYGNEGELLSVAGSAEPVTKTYDALYRLSTLTDGGGHKTSYYYNAAGYLDTVTYPGYMGPAPAYNTATGQWDNVSGKDSLRYPAYDLDGNVTQRVDGRGTITNYFYSDPENRLTDIQYPATTSLNVHFNYDAFGRRGNTTAGSPGMMDATGSAAYAYDDDDDLTSVVTSYTGLPAQTVSYQYYPDAVHRTMTTPAGVFTYAYDNDGRLKSVTNPFTEASTWTFFDNGWLKTQTLSNGAVTTYTPNPLGLLTDLVNKTSGGTTLTDFGTVKYDGVGDRTAMTATVPGATAYGGTTTDTYDYGQTANALLNRSQVTSEVTSRNGGSTGTFSYDGGIGTGAGNPTTFPGKTFAYNADNQITSTGYLYDGAGNATTFGTTTIAYDAENRLTGYGSALTAGYTGDNLRAWKQNSAGTRTYFLYDGGSPVCELSSTGAVTATNTWGRNGLLSRRVGSTSGFYTFDLSGNTAQTLSSTGAVTLTAAVGAFGQRTASGTTIDPYSGLGGQWGCYNDSESGLFLMGHRYYSATAGRFLTRDPMGYAGGVNLYAYCGNDPVNENDPLGFAGHPNGGDWLFDLSDASSAFGSTASFGATDVVNGWTGADAVVDKCSVAYGAGAITGTVVQSLAFGGAGAAADEAAEGAQAAERAAQETEEATCGDGINCFVAGTPVEMADGSTKPIQDVHVGDVVKSRDPDTGKDVDEQVTATFMHPVQMLVTVTATDATTGQTETFTCTPEHPFFVQGRGFVCAGNLTAGMMLSSGLHDRLHGCLSVTGVEWRKAAVKPIPGLVSDGTPVYNFTVAYTHTYFVGTLNGGTWVHNKCPDDLTDLMKDAPLNAGQNEVNGQVVDKYADMLKNGSEAPPIEVEEGSNVITNGHHRYIAGRMMGQDPPINWIPQGAIPSSSVPWGDVFVDQELPIGLR